MNRIARAILAANADITFKKKYKYNDQQLLSDDDLDIDSATSFSEQFRDLVEKNFLTYDWFKRVGVDRWLKFDIGIDQLVLNFAGQFFNCKEPSIVEFKKKYNLSRYTSYDKVYDEFFDIFSNGKFEGLPQYDELVEQLNDE